MAILRIPLTLAVVLLILAPSLGAAGSLMPTGVFPASGQEDGLRIYISVDMEGLGGIGVPEMTRNGGKDYAVGRRMMTEELNVVIAGIRAAASERGIDRVEILINDSHGDHSNVLIEQLAEGVEYQQGSLKPLGMVQGLDASFDAVIFVGYHARASTEGFLAHTGSGRVRNLRINGVPSGEGEMNAALAGAHGVPVALVAGDAAFVDQARHGYAADAKAVVTKWAVTGEAAHLRPVAEVRQELREKAKAAILELDELRPWRLDPPIVVDIEFNSETHCDIATGIPGVERTGPMSVRFEAGGMPQAYRLIRILYRFLST